MGVKSWSGGVIRKTPVTPAGPYSDSAASGMWTLERVAYWRRQGLWPTSGNINPARFIENIFSTWLYTGTGATQTITNNIDTSTNGGLVWFKSRSAVTDHALYDTTRGATFDIGSNLTTAQTTQATGLTAFTTNGFTIGALAKLNTNSAQYASWTFRKQAKFFDIVTYTGNGTAGRTVAHNLGSTPGCIIVKRTNDAKEWNVYHRSMTANGHLELDSTAQKITSAQAWNNTEPTSTVFTVGNDLAVNGNGSTYVAYLFAHDAGGFGLTGTDNVISCGSFTTSAGGTATVTLGYEPQWLLVKTSADVGTWQLIDIMRGMPFGTVSLDLAANSTATEGSGYTYSPTATGFTFATEATRTYIYIAIRRGPMKTPTTGTEVFQPIVYTGTNVDNRKVTTNILTDMIMARQRNSSTVAGFVVGDRLRGNQYVLTGVASAGVTDADSLMTPTLGYGNSFSVMDGFGAGNDATSQLNQSTVASNQVVEAFRRAPGFLDIVAYNGTSSARTVGHNLGVTPEMIWVKCTTTGTRNWIVYSSIAGQASYLNLNSNGDVNRGSLGEWNGTSPNTSVFTVGTDAETNNSGDSYVAYLMGSVSGVSKCSYYVGKGVGNVNQVDCGFTSGARFVIIKSLNRTGAAGDWFVYDSARGIVSGNDPYLWPHSTNAEATGTDYIDTYANGFELSTTAPDELNDGYADFWTAQAAVLGTADITGIVYGDNLWVAGGSAGTIAYSSNAYSWTTVAGVVTGGVNQITYGNGLYVAVGGSGRISTSANAITWSTRTSGLSTTLTGVTYGFGKYWVVDSSGNLISSTDGVTWSTVSTGISGAFNEIDFLNNNLIIVGGTGLIITSSDGVTFTSRTSGTTNDLENATYANNLYVVVGDSGTILTSSDLVTWTARSAGALAGNNINDVVWASYRFIAVATAGEVGYSADGITWSTGSGAGGNPLISVAFANDILLTGNGDGDIYISDPKYIYWAIA
jgi:hypothetical protein